MAAQRDLSKMFDGVKSVRSRTVTITKAKAEEMLLKHTYSRQRPIRRVTVGALGLMADEGTLRPGTQLSVGSYGKTTAVLDGHHRLHTIVETGIPMQVTLTHYKCADMQTLHNLYVTYDNGIGHRSKADMFIAYYGKKVLDGIGKTGINRLVSAVTFIADKFSQSIARIQTHYTVLYCQVAFCFLAAMAKLCRVFEGETGALKRATLYRQSILSVALITMKHSPKKAKRFWHAVAHNGVVRPGCGSQTLREFLLMVQSAKDRNAFGQRKLRYTPRALAYIVADCWNHYYRGEELTEVRAEAAATGNPINIEGTPYSHSAADSAFDNPASDYGIGPEHAEAVKRHVKRSHTGYKPGEKKAKKKAAPKKTAKPSTKAKGHKRVRIDFTDKQLKRMKKMRDEGKSYATIAEIFRVSLNTIKRRLVEYAKRSAKVVQKPEEPKRKRKSG